jgi:glyoxylase-like metal-dependent hydrolase (beta-lactamase superfamily II)
VRAEAFLRLDRELLQRVQGGRKPPLPTLTFDSKVVLQRGKRVEIFFLGRGHTDGDAVLILPEQKVALLGDLLFNQALPNLQDGYTRDWIVTLEKILTLGAERFLPGHGPVVSADGVRDMIAYLVYLRGAVEPHVKAGRGLDEVKLRVKLPEAYASYRFRHLFPSNLEKVYQELKEGR